MAATVSAPPAQARDSQAREPWPRERLARGLAARDPGSREPGARRMRTALGTFVAIEATSHTAGAAHGGVVAAFAAVTAVEQRMHPWAAGSDLARINSAPPHTAVRVHVSTWKLLKLAKRLNEMTDGVFDPCLPRRPARLRDVELVAATGEGAGCENARADCENAGADYENAGADCENAGADCENAAADCGVEHGDGGGWVICHAPAALDFGGFAKGYAVDCAIAALIGVGCSSGLVNAGGDLRVFGPRAETVLLRRPRDHYNTFALRDASVAVSDAGARHRPVEHQGYYYAQARRYAAVVAREAVIADALVKCVLLCPAAVSEHALREFNASCISED